MPESYDVKDWSHPALKPIGVGISTIVLGVTLEAASLAPNAENLRTHGGAAMLIGGGIILGALFKTGWHEAYRERQ